VKSKCKRAWTSEGLDRPQADHKLCLQLNKEIARSAAFMTEPPCPPVSGWCNFQAKQRAPSYGQASPEEQARMRRGFREARKERRRSGLGEVVRQKLIESGLGLGLDRRLGGNRLGGLATERRECLLGEFTLEEIALVL